MENIYNLPKTSKTPEIFIDFDNKIITMKGRCIIEDAHTFFVNLIERIKNIDDLTYIFDLEYINSSSLKHIISMLKDYLKLYQVEWCYQEDDFDIQEKGLDIKYIIEELNPNIKFILTEKPM